jgi:hypothetical protein
VGNSVEIESSLVKGRVVTVMWEDASESVEGCTYEELASSCWSLEVGKKRAAKCHDQACGRKV